MSASSRWKAGVAAAGLFCLALSIAWAEEITTTERPAADQARQNTSGASGQTDRSATQQPGYSATARERLANYRGAQAGGASAAVDHYLANCVLGKNKGEVELSEIAQQKAENPQVKEFAQKMVQDHRKLIEQLQPLAGAQAGATPGTAGTYGTQGDTSRSSASDIANNREKSESATRTSGATTLPGSSGTSTTTTTTGSEGAADRMAGGGAIRQLGQIEKQIGDRCLQNAKDELQQKSGAEFDKCYVGMAIGAHMQALAALEVIGQQTQGKLAQVAQQAQPTVKEHLEMAKQLMKQLESQSSATGNRAARQSTTRTE
jgi:predicted outer membrane protein